MDNSNTSYLFKCKTTDAYIFKTLTELLHNIIKTACFEITPKGISMRMMDSNRRTLVDLQLGAENFNLYYFAESIEGQVLNIGLNMNYFYKMLKSIKKRDQLILFIEEKQSLDLGIQIVPKDFSRLTISYVKIQNIQNLEIALPDKYEHSILVSSNEFSKMCKDMFNMSNTICIAAKKYTIGFLCNVGSVYSRQVILGDTEAQRMNSEVSENDFSEDYDTEQLSRILKVAGLAQNLNIHCVKNMPLLLTSKVGIMGDIKIFVKSRRQLEDESQTEAVS
jgi:proliferating cell nuclear antigen PCNA